MKLFSNRLTLREFKLEDAATLSTLCNNRKIWDNVRDAMSHPYTLKDATDFIEKTANKEPQETFAIEYNNKLIGCIGIHPQTDVYRLSAEIGYWIGEPSWGQGFATEAIELILNYGLTELNLIRIYAGCFEFNKASQRVLEKAGFKKEGTFKNAVLKNNAICDEIRYAYVKTD